jgi:multidrug efflux pump subunit AcrA (membrane-fusion protein)
MADLERKDTQTTDPAHQLPQPHEPAALLDDGGAHRERERAAAAGSRRFFWIFAVGAVVLFLLVFVLGWLPRHHREEETRKLADKERNAKPVVEVVRVRPSTEGGGLVVPGTAAALTEAYVYARANGYLTKRLVDIGDKVREGQLLAIVDSPDLDQQVDQARQQLNQTQAQLAQQRAQLALTRVTVERYRVLVAKGVFSRQDGDQREADFAAQQANVASAERNVEAFRANLRRMISLQGYERVTAPFNGVITQRNVDVGALISAQGSSSGAQAGPAPTGQSSTSGGSSQTGQSNNAGSSGAVNAAATSSASPGQGGPLFGVAQMRRLRVLVSVPEGYAASIHKGVAAKLNFQEYPQQTFSGEVTRTSGSLDQNTRTLLTEVQVDNAGGKLMPGMYVVATFPAVAGAAPLVVPGDSVAIRKDKSVVATVVDGKVRIIPVTLGRDYGTSIEVLNGLREGDWLITNVTDDVVEGAAVEPRETKAAAPQKPQQSPPAQKGAGGQGQPTGPGAKQ